MYTSLMNGHLTAIKVKYDWVYFEREKKMKKNRDNDLTDKSNWMTVDQRLLNNSIRHFDSLSLL